MRVACVWRACGVRVGRHSAREHSRSPPPPQQKQKQQLRRARDYDAPARATISSSASARSDGRVADADAGSAGVGVATSRADQSAASASVGAATSGAGRSDLCHSPINVVEARRAVFTARAVQRASTLRRAELGTCGRGVSVGFGFGVGRPAMSCTLLDERRHAYVVAGQRHHTT